MDAVVLVGGEGTRLRPLTYEVPKQMLPVVERPMIVHVIEWLATHGVDRAVLSLGYRADAFMEAFPSQEIAGVALEYVVEPELLDTAGAIRFAASEAGVKDTFLVLNGDVLTEVDASALVAFHRTRPAQASIALTPVQDPSRFGVVPTDEDGRVTAFIEKPPPGQAPTNLINAGIYVLETSVLEQIPEGRRVSDRAGDLSRPRVGGLVVRPCFGRLLARHRYPAAVPASPARHLDRPAVAGARCAGDQQRALGRCEGRGLLHARSALSGRLRGPDRRAG